MAKVKKFPKPREEPLYLQFSVVGAERMRLECLAQGMGFRDPRAIAADIFRVGLMMTFARYEPNRKCRTARTISLPSSAAPVSRRARASKS